MERSRQTGLLGLAVMRGMIGPEALGRVALALPEGGTLLEAVLAQGLLTREDLEQLAELMEAHGLAEQAQEAPSGPPTRQVALPGAADAPRTREPEAGHPRAEASGPSPSMLGRRVLDATRLPAWKHFRNLTFLAEGGMGRVFKAFDPVLKREVALKFLARDEPDKVLRFVLEAQHQARVDHPNICKVYEVGEWKGQAYIAMQLIHGRTLVEIRDDLTLREKVAVVQVAAEAVHAAHRQGLVHRDLKPGNIMVERDGATLKPYLLDFGLARGLEATGLTQQGVAVGTLGYMAPEQARGVEGAVGFAADLYGLGATLYMLLAGDPPFVDSSGLELLRRTVEEEPRPMSTLGLDLPRDLDTIVLKCLEKEPGRRYASALALAEDLRRFLADEPLLATPPDWRDALRKRVRRNRSLSLVVGVAAVAMLALGAVALRAQWRARTQALLAQRFGMESEALAGSYRWAQTLPLHDMRRHKAELRAWMARLEAEMLREGSVARAPGSFALGRACLTLGEPDRALAYLEQAWKAGYRAPACAELLGLAHGTLLEEGLAASLGQSTKALQEARVAELKRLHGDPALTYLRLSGTTPSLVHEGRMAYLEGRYDEALAKAQLALARDPWLVEAQLLIGQTHLARGRRCLDQGGYEACLQDAAQARLAGVQVQTLARSQADGYALEADGNLLAMLVANAQAQPSAQQAEACRIALEQALRADPEAGPIHMRMTTLFMQKAAVDLDLGRSPEPDLAVAMNHGQEAIRYGPSDPGPIAAMANLCFQRAAYRATHGLDPLPFFAQSLTWHQQAIALAPQDFHPPIDQGLTLQTRATFLQKHGEDPRPDLWASLASYATACRLKPDYWVAWANRGISLRRLASVEAQEGGDPLPLLAQAQDCYQEAIKCNPRSPAAYNNLGILHKFRAELELRRGVDARASLDAAAAALDQALAIKPGHAFSLCGLGDVAFLRALACEKAGGDPLPHYREAQRRYRQALASNPTDGGMDEKAGLAWMEQGRFEAAQGHPSAQAFGNARKAFLEGLRIDRDSSDSLLGLARLQARDAALVQAAGTVAKARALSPAAAEPLLLQAEIALAGAERSTASARAAQLDRAEAALKASETCRKWSPMRKVLQAQALLLRGGRDQARGARAEALLRSAFAEDHLLDLTYGRWLARAEKAKSEPG